ncbi:MAG: sugar ABC transporter permease [Tyzzerella sp.]|nr:sugar ABC transporter permease [Tyzzerella sp.]
MQTKPVDKKKKRWKTESKIALAVAVIPLLGFIIFNGFPLLISFIGMFCNVDLYDLSNIQWNNFEGFKSVFIERHAFDLFYFDLSKYFYKAIWITLWIASTQFITLGIALFIATLLREKMAGSKLFQVLFFIPYICSTVAVALMWRWIFDWEGGILNSILGTDMKWLENPKTITWCIIIAVIWSAPGYGIVMYKAAFSNINSALYEAAAVDGANAWHKFRHVTLPGISPTTFFLMQAGIGAGLLTYDLAQLIIPNAWGVPGGNESMGLTMMRLVYYLITNSTTTDANGVSYMVSCACVISWLLFVVTGALSMVMFRLREKSAE